MKRWAGMQAGRQGGRRAGRQGGRKTLGSDFLRPRAPRSQLGPTPCAPRGHATAPHWVAATRAPPRGRDIRPSGAEASSFPSLGRERAERWGEGPPSLARLSGFRDPRGSARLLFFFLLLILVLILILMLATAQGIWLKRPPSPLQQRSTG